MAVVYDSEPYDPPLMARVVTSTNSRAGFFSVNSGRKIFILSKEVYIYDPNEVFYCCVAADGKPWGAGFEGEVYLDMASVEFFNGIEEIYEKAKQK